MKNGFELVKHFGSFRTEEKEGRSQVHVTWRQQCANCRTSAQIVLETSNDLLLYIKTQSAPCSKHTSSRLYKPVNAVYGNNRCLF